MSKTKILWADDEISLLKPHIMFLEEKGYEVISATNGQDAINICKNQQPDIVFLDENMPGKDGLETLTEIKQLYPNTPIIMITKSEEEEIMDQAIGSKISDYLIKPVNPMQILLTIKKNINKEEIINEATKNTFQQNFSRLSMEINNAYSVDDWITLYKKLVYWELELQETKSDMKEILTEQYEDANRLFCKFVMNNYLGWLENPDSRPTISNDIFKKNVFPLLDNNETVFFILIDNFRYDQWEIIKPLLSDKFNIDEEISFSILPTTTQYARNSIFSGLLPLQIEKMFPQLWVEEDSEGGKNLNESPLIETLLKRYRKNYSFSYDKINNNKTAEKLLINLNSGIKNPLNVIVFNFIDMMSHARTESKMIRELANSEAAYRSLTESWYKHSAITDLIEFLSDKKVKIIITTDHGTIKVNNAIKIIGDRNTNTNLRYKVGKSLNYETKDVFEIKEPKKYGLPCPNISSTYVFATGDRYFAYPNNYNYYASYFKNTFQHGGISMQEMMTPLITLTPKI